MRIAIVTTQSPFVLGGAELHAQSLLRALRDAGHNAEIVSMPYKGYPPQQILDRIIAARCLDISESNGVKIDLAICLKFPAYLMQHPNKVFWILHQERAAYDLWESGLSNFFQDDYGQIVRQAINEANNIEFQNAKRIFANSRNVAKRLMSFNGIVAEPLYHPPPLADQLKSGPAGDFFFYPSRITPIKRQDFVLRALAQTNTPCKVVFSGNFDSPEYGLQLKELARELGVSSRVIWRDFVSDSELIELYASARGILFTPVDEDLGYVALEAMLAQKPLLTTEDAGEPAFLIRDQIEGLVSKPDTHAFARAMDRIYIDDEISLRLGAAGAKRYRSLNISWDSVVNKLVTQMAEKSLNLVLKSRPADDALSDARRSAPGNQKQITNDTGRERIKTHIRKAAADVTHHINRLFTLYDFGTAIELKRSHAATRWPLYEAIIQALKFSGLRPKRILHLGISAPNVFAVRLRELYPNAELFGLQETPLEHSWNETIKSRDKKAAPDIEIQIVGLHIETAHWPYEDDSFDLIIATEILERLTIDPSFVFREASRVLRTGGQILVSTPNLVSWSAVECALNGVSPYSFGMFVPWNGTYGRHNREYTAMEVEALGKYAGFETSMLETFDISDQKKIPSELLRQFEAADYPLDLRGQNIFYQGQKRATKISQAYPKELFSIDPAIFDATLELIQGHTPRDFIVTIKNKSPLTWYASGRRRIQLCVDRIDQTGFTQKDIRRFDLPHDLVPNQTVQIPVRAASDIRKASSWFEIGLYIDNVGPFKNAGRTNTISIFAEDLLGSET